MLKKCDETFAELEICFCATKRDNVNGNLLVQHDTYHTKFQNAYILEVSTISAH